MMILLITELSFYYEQVSTMRYGMISFMGEVVDVFFASSENIEKMKESE